MTTSSVRKGANGIQADVLVVNQHFVSVNEVLYGLSQRGGISAVTSRDEARRRIIPRVQQEVGTLLIYDKATAKLNERQREAIDAGLTKQIDRRVAVEFENSQARFEQHLGQFGLSRKQHRTWLERQLVARDYLREFVFPQISITRSDLLAAYETRRSAAVGPETRELFLIEAPFAAFLPQGLRWDDADPAARSRAQASAEQQIRRAEAALASGRGFQDVAREFDRGAHQPDGGAWGFIGKPLRSPYDVATRRLFTLKAADRSEPIRSDGGWYIVQCGAVKGGPMKGDFESLQSTLRAELEEQRFNELSIQYLTELAASASISSIESFVETAAQRLMDRGNGAPSGPSLITGVAP